MLDCIDQPLTSTQAKEERSIITSCMDDISLKVATLTFNDDIETLHESHFDDDFDFTRGLANLSQKDVTTLVHCLAELEDLRKEKGRLESELKKLKDFMAIHYDTKITDERSKNDIIIIEELTLEVATLKKKIIAKEKLITDQCLDFDNSLTEAESALKKVSNELEMVKRKEESYRKKIETIEENINKSEVRIKYLETTIKEFHQQIEKEEKKQKDQNEDIKYLNEKLIEYETELDKKHGLIKKEQLNTISNEIKNSALNNQITELEEINRTNENIIKQHEETAKITTISLKDQIDENNELKLRIDKLEERKNLGKKHYLLKINE